MEVRHRARDAHFRLHCRLTFLSLGMESRKVADRTQYAISSSICNQILVLTRATQVYIFKHMTVTGVYITMFVKYVNIISSLSLIPSRICSFNSFLT